jgi:hypothetical protein
LNDIRFNAFIRKTSAREFSALVQFYNDLNGDIWVINNNWLVGDPCEVIKYKKIQLYQTIVQQFKNF